MKLPLLISVPHAGTRIPDEVRDYCILNQADVIADGDVGAKEIYGPLKEKVEAFVTTDIARAVVDLNRGTDDRRKDGVVKTHTCWDVPVYEPFPPERIVQQVLDHHYHPYHARLEEWAAAPGIKMGVDCHTMAEFGPPVGPDAGKKRPPVCLGHGGGTSCPPEWAVLLRESFQNKFGSSVTLDDPFAGGYITRRHGLSIPFIQLELSRMAAWSDREKSRFILAALTAFSHRMGWLV